MKIQQSFSFPAEVDKINIYSDGQCGSGRRVAHVMEGSQVDIDIAVGLDWF